MPAGSINQGKIKATKTYIGTLLQQIEPGIQITNENIDSVIQQQMEKRNITPTFYPRDTNLTQFVVYIDSHYSQNSNFHLYIIQNL